MTNNTVELNIATTNTAKATKDVKSLREQIKDLKNEMAGLTQGTEEYDAAAAQLGDLMHQQAEITEAAKLATNDYGQTLSNITSISAGVVGSISAMNGVLNLVGASSDEATEAMRKIQSLMAIVQGLNQIDAAEKAFKGLWTRIKLLTAAKKDDTQETIKNTAAENQNTAAGAANAVSMKAQTVAAHGLKGGLISLSAGFKALGRAITSFMMSNPFTAIVTVITTVIGLITLLKDDTEDAIEDMNKLKLEAIEASGALMNDLAGDTSNTMMKEYGKQLLAVYEMFSKFRVENDEFTKRNSSAIRSAADGMKKAVADAQKEIVKLQYDLNLLKQNGLEDTDEYRKGYQQLLEAQTSYYSMYAMQQHYYYDEFKIRWENYLGEVRKGTDKFTQEEADAMKAQLDAIEKNWNDAMINLAQSSDKQMANQTAENKRLDSERAKNADKAKRAAEKRRADELKAIQTAYERQKLLTNGLYRDQELTTEEYYDRQLKELQDYLAKWTELRKKHNKQTGVKGILDENEKATWLTEEDLLEIEKMNNQEVELERKKTEAIIDLRKRQADALNYRPDSSRSSVNEARYQKAQNAMTDETGARYLEQQDELYNAWWVKKYRLIQEHNQAEIEEERRHNDELRQLSMEHYAEEERVLEENRDGDMAYEEQRFDNEMSYLMQRCEAKLITQEEYNLAVEEQEREHQERMWEIQNEYNDGLLEVQTQRTETLRDIAQQRYEIEAEEFERRKELISSYISAYQSINSAISGILGQAQQMYKEGSKEYEEIQEASIIMDTISGSLAAFMSGVKSGIPAPYNFILGGVLSAAAIAEGAMALNNLHSKKLSSGASNAPSVSAYQTVAYETGAELSGDIQDQRVYVTETDISDTLTRVNVMESESTF